MTLFEKLDELNKSDFLPLHMPGHKRKFEFGRCDSIYGIDITEIDGFDDLADPDGILLEMMGKAAELYMSDYAFISVNGATAANEAAILAVCNPGDEIIMSRACHKSVYYAMEMAQANPVYIEPVFYSGTDVIVPVNAEQVSEAYNRTPDAKCVIITSPTYEGLSADIGEISEAVHSHGGILIVDCAHGAHFGFSDSTPQNPIKLGADAVIVSLHKTLPAPTQTALLLIKSERIDIDRIRHFMRVFQTSSPSYILMAGIGECLKFVGDKAPIRLNELSDRVEDFKKQTRCLSILETDVLKDAECGKIIVFCRKAADYGGYDLYRELIDTYHIQCEMYSNSYVLAMVSVMDEDDTFIRFAQALKQIDSKLKRNKEDSNCYLKLPMPQSSKSIRTAINGKKRRVSIDDSAVGLISASYVMAYPPGIPVLVPGEIIDKAVVMYISKGLENGLNIVGLKDRMLTVVE